MNAISDLLKKVHDAEAEVKNARKLVAIMIIKLGGSVEIDHATLMNPGEYETKVTEDPVTGSMTIEARHIRIIKGDN